MNFYGECKDKRRHLHPLSLLTAFARFPLLSLRDIFPQSGGSRPSRGRLWAVPENFAATAKAVPLGKVSSPQAMTEGVSPSHLPPQVKIATGGKKDYTIKNVCGAQAAGAEEMKHETTGLL